MDLINLQKYVLILEKVSEQVNKELPEIDKVIEIVETDLQDVVVTLQSIITTNIGFSNLLSEVDHQQTKEHKFIMYLYHILLTIKDNINNSNEAAAATEATETTTTNPSDVLSVKQLSNFIIILNVAANYGIFPYLKQSFKEFQCFKELHRPAADQQNLTTQPIEINTKLKYNLMIFSELFQLTRILNNLDNTIMLLYIAGCHCCLMNDSKVKTTTTTANNEIQLQLNEIYQRLSKEMCFKLLLILKSIKSLPIEIKKSLHKDLLWNLQEPNGFLGLCQNIIGNNEEDTIEHPLWRRVQCIQQIIGQFALAHHHHHHNHNHNRSPTLFHMNIIKQIKQFLMDDDGTTTTTNNNNVYVNISIGILLHLYKLLCDCKIIKATISGIFLHGFDQLHKPMDLLTGTILLDNLALHKLLQINSIAFGRSTAITDPLNSSLLIQYLPLLFQLLHLFVNEQQQETTNNISLQKQITSMISQCLANRPADDKELHQLIKMILYQQYDNEKVLHPRVIIKLINEQYSIQIGPPVTQQLPSLMQQQNITSSTSETAMNLYDPAETLINMLKLSNNNILTYKIFLYLLELLSDCIDTRKTNQLLETDLLTDIDDLTNVVSQALHKRMTIISVLIEFINYKSFHHLFNDNPMKILNVFQTLLLNKIKSGNVKSGGSTGQSLTNDDANNDNDEIMIIILSIIKEFVEQLKTPDEYKNSNFVNTLKELKLLYKNNSSSSWEESTDNNNSKTINKQIENILSNFEEKSSQKCCLFSNGDDDDGDRDNSQNIKINQAKELCAANEIHLKVYGIRQLISLIKNRDCRDDVIAQQRHTILAIALHLLKSEDSYVFLNCIKLLIALVDILKCNVIDTLMAEYSNEQNEIDYRLKLGECIVKVTEGLGTLSYLYKDQLINGLLNGPVNCRQNEIRLSSLSNLGTICQILSYQIHTFFHELMLIINKTIKYDEYLPARRAAIMILSQILIGIGNLSELEEFLLPVYRQLKSVIDSENDQQMLMHATHSLELLTTHINKFLCNSGGGQPKHEIRIFNIKDDVKNVRITELN